MGRGYTSKMYQLYTQDLYSLLLITVVALECHSWLIPSWQRRTWMGRIRSTLELLAFFRVKSITPPASLLILKMH